MALSVPVDLSGAEDSWQTNLATTQQDGAKSENPSVLDSVVPTLVEIDYFAAKGIETAPLNFLLQRAQLILDGPAVPKDSNADPSLQPDQGALPKDDATGSISTPSSSFFDLWAQPLWQSDDVWGGG